jgi:hypothetical protein
LNCEPGTGDETLPDGDFLHPADAPTHLTAPVRPHPLGVPTAKDGQLRSRVNDQAADSASLARSRKSSRILADCASIYVDEADRLSDRHRKRE